MDNMLKKQAEWQQGRAKLSWAEKLRQSIVLRDAQRLMKNRVQESKGKYCSQE